MTDTLKTNHDDEKRFEELLKKALEEKHAEELDLVPSSEELDKKIVFSKRHQRRMKKLLASGGASSDEGGRGMSMALLFRILITAVLLVGLLVFGMAVYSRNNPAAGFLPAIKDMFGISGKGPIKNGDCELEFTENMRSFGSVEELNQVLPFSILYPRTQGTQFSITAVRYAEFPDRKLVMLSLNGGCGISIYAEDARYSIESFSEEDCRQIGGKNCWLMEVSNGIQAVMMEDDLYYVISAPDLVWLESLISIMK